MRAPLTVVMADSIVIGVQTGVGEQLPATKQFTVYLLRPADSCNWIIWSSQAGVQWFPPARHTFYREQILPKDADSVKMLPQVTKSRNQTHNPRRHQST
ncbi:hypothetical protein J6590_039862 [Homalodisca vitripennis]|nr:hypothetical protein J6590_104693 [Homalodisca vitripennis]KAG8331511.1 hypothetical protein J6590_039862 [Homalodisca vitripennis]